jgi:predicted NAD/FAD-dependent oxidoreductase
LAEKSQTKPVLIVGAGITGVACARVLRTHGVPFRIVNKGKKLGGRMATKVVRDSGTEFDGRVFDIGASYFTVSDPEFQVHVQDMLDLGIVTEWTDTFHVADDTGILGVKVGPMRYSAPKGIRSVVEYLAQGLEVSEGEFEGEIDSLDVADERIALCMPTPQAAKIFPRATELNPCVWEPVIAVLMLFAEQYWQDFDGIFDNSTSAVTWIANDGSRRGDRAPALVAHVHPVLSSQHLVDPSAVISFAVSAVAKILDFDQEPVWTSAHRWTFAKPVEGTTRSEPLFNAAPEEGVFMAGDSFSDRPRVEAGWISGSALGKHLVGTR